MAALLPTVLRTAVDEDTEERPDMGVTIGRVAVVDLTGDDRDAVPGLTGEGARDRLAAEADGGAKEVREARDGRDTAVFSGLLLRTLLDDKLGRDEARDDVAGVARAGPAELDGPARPNIAPVLVLVSVLRIAGVRGWVWSEVEGRDPGREEGVDWTERVVCRGAGLSCRKVSSDMSSSSSWSERSCSSSSCA